MLSVGKRNLTYGISTCRSSALAIILLCEAGGRERLTRHTSIVMAIASSIDLNTLHELSRTCRQVRQALLQYRSSILAHSLHCVNEDVPIDPEDTFRYRARAGNWFYMEDGRTGEYNGKSGKLREGHGS